MPKGVDVRGDNIRVFFRYKNHLYRETLNLQPTSDNIAYAQRMVKQIRFEITAGTFDYGRYFANSSHLHDHTLGHYLDLWLEIKTQRVAESTYRGYLGICERYIRPSFGMRQADSIDRIEVETWISETLKTLASKTIKETIAVLRQVYALYRTRYPATLDPTAGITIALPDDEDPDPFTQEEMKKIGQTPPRNNRIQELNMIQFMLWSGPRVSEVIALAWEDVVDLEAGLVYFRRARVRGQFKSTKTKRSKRIHELVAPAREALQRQKALTYALEQQAAAIKQRDNRTIKTEQLRFVFLNSHTGEPHYNDFSLRDRFFKEHLRRANVRYRGPGQCRHTYISQMLTAGMPIEWIAKQTGTSTEMIRRRYGKWMEEDAIDLIKLAEKRLNL